MIFSVFVGLNVFQGAVLYQYGSSCLRLWYEMSNLRVHCAAGDEARRIALFYRLEDVPFGLEYVAQDVFLGFGILVLIEQLSWTGPREK